MEVKWIAGGLSAVLLLSVATVVLVSGQTKSAGEAAAVATALPVPVFTGTTTPPELAATSYLVVDVEAGKETTLTASHEHDPHALASVTKLMTALVASERFAPSDLITITKDAIPPPTNGRSWVYKGGEELTFATALEALLIPSHNEVANALAIAYGPTFVPTMNATAQELGLTDTSYVNPSGLDPVNPSDPYNESTAYDTYRLIRFINEEHPDLLAVTRTATTTITTSDGATLANIVSTDPLLADASSPFPIVGGKTGETDLARQNLVLALSSPCGGYLYAVVLDSPDRAKDMKALLDWVHESYVWNFCAPS